MGIYRERCNAFFQKQRLDRAEALLVQTQPNIRYFSGFTGDSGALLISETQRTLFTDFRYTEQAQKQAPDFEVREFSGGGYLHLVKDEIETQGFFHIGMEESSISFQTYRMMEEIERCRWLYKSEEIDCLRMKKSSDELENMREAGRIGIIALTSHTGRL